MKELMTPTFIARDGTRFTTAAECKAYELDNLPKLLAEATAAEIKAAFAREDLEMADLIEQAGDRIRRDRLAAGDRKKARKGEGANSKAATAPEAGDEPAGESITEDELKRRMDLQLEGAKAFLAKFGPIPPDDLHPGDHQWWVDGYNAEFERAQLAAA